MSRRRNPLPIFEKVKVVDISSQGKAIAKSDDLVIFLENAVPGDLVDIQVTKKKKNYYEGKVLRYIEYSKDRVEPVCKHFGVCGGCKWQHMGYADQLRHKQAWIEQNFKKIAKMELPAVSAILGSDETEYYRNKLEFAFSNKKWLTHEQMLQLRNETLPEEHEQNGLGLHIPSKFDKVIDLEECHLQAEPSNSIRLAVRNYALENKLEFFDIRAQKGLLRNLIIRTTLTGDLMVLLSFYKDNKVQINGLMEYLIEQFPQISSLMYVINPKKNDTILDLDIKIYHGKGNIMDVIGDLKFNIGPKTFFQTNTKQASALYKVVAEYAELTGTELVYDLYTGSGTIANYLAKDAKKVLGIESVPEAIEDAKANSLLNKISNTEFLAGDLKDVLNDDLIAIQGNPDVIVTDPPRAGMHEDVVKCIMKIAPEKIIYVSCNSATQARDISLMADQYKIEKMQPVDMFPHTHHVENIALLLKKKQ